MTNAERRAGDLWAAEQAALCARVQHMSPLPWGHVRGRLREKETTRLLGPQQDQENGNG